MDNAILHISDLHFVLDIDVEKTRFDRSFQSTLFGDIEKAQTNHKIKIKYVVITGDLSDNAKVKQYEKVTSFLNSLVEKFKIDKKNILICPGNHDISWNDLDKEIENKNITNQNEVYKLHDIKFANFKNFYDSFFDGLKAFIPTDAIVDKVIDEDDKILLIGLNTCYRESNQSCDHIGYIDLETLQEGFSKIDFSLYSDYGKLLVMHHNPKKLASEEHGLKNWDKISPITIEQFQTILCGHIHDSDGEALVQYEEGCEYYVSVGSLTKKYNKADNRIDNTFNILYKNKSSNNEALILFYQLVDAESKPVWQHITEKKCVNKVTICRIVTENIREEKVDKTWDIKSEKQLKETIKAVQSPKLSEISITNVLDLSLVKLMNYIQTNELFKSGHFHWSPTFRSHGIIDINYLVSSSDTLELLTKLFYDKIIEKVGGNLQNAIIIGVGIECNIIGSRLSVLFPNYHYSFIPDPAKKDFSVIEKELKEGNYENIILLKDIIFDAESLKEILNHIAISNNQKFFVLSLFYCGQKNDEYKIFEDHLLNISHFSICNEIQIHKCNYNYEGGMKDCPIIKYDLDKFYER